MPFLAYIARVLQTDHSFRERLAAYYRQIKPIDETVQYYTKGFPREKLLIEAFFGLPQLLVAEVRRATRNTAGPSWAIFWRHQHTIIDLLISQSIQPTEWEMFWSNLRYLINAINPQYEHDLRVRQRAILAEAAVVLAIRGLGRGCQLASDIDDLEWSVDCWSEPWAIQVAALRPIRRTDGWVITSGGWPGEHRHMRQKWANVQRKVGKYNARHGTAYRPAIVVVPDSAFDPNTAQPLDSFKNVLSTKLFNT